MLTKLRKPVPERDRLVVIEETGVADIASVFDADDKAIYAESAVQEYAVPVEDVRQFVGPAGRIYVLAATPEYIGYTKNLAELQKSIVLEKVTHYQRQPDEQPNKLRLKDIAVGALIFVLVLAVIFK